MSYQITGVNSADVSSPLTGSVTLDANGKAYVDVVTVADKTTEGAETIKFALSGGESASTALTDSSLDAVKSLSLSTSVDALVGTAGNDTIKATAANQFNALDTIDGGAGTDLLDVQVDGTITEILGKIAGVETVNIVATGAVGTTEKLPKVAVKQVQTFSFVDSVSGTTATYLTTDKITVKVGDKELVVNPTAATAAGAADAVEAAIESLMDAAYGAGTYAVQGAAAGTDDMIVRVTSGTAGTPLPTISVSAKKADGTTAVNYKATVDATDSGAVANVKASAGTAAAQLSLGAVDGATTATVKATDQVNVAGSSTMDVTIDSGSTTILAGAKNATITSYGEVTATSLKGAVSVSVSDYAAGNSVIKGGTTVAFAQVGGKVATAGTYGTHATSTVTVGAAADVATNPASAVGAQYNKTLSSNPTGDVSVSVVKTFTTPLGQKAALFGEGAVTVYTNGGANVSVTGGATATITDIQTTPLAPETGAAGVAGTSKLATVTLDGVSGASNITSDALTTLKLFNSYYDADGAGTSETVRTASSVTVTNKTSAHALNLVLSNNGTGTTVTDAKAGTVSITTQASDLTTAAQASASALNLVAAAATTVSFANSQAVTLEGSTSLVAATTITATGSGKLDLGTVGSTTSGASTAKLTSVDASGASGALVATVAATIAGGATDHGLSVTGGSGADVITLTGAMKSGTNAAGASVSNTISLGGGNDTVLNSGTGAIQAGSSVNGGEGVDTIVASLLNSGNASLITNFEVLGLDLTSGTYDSDLLTGATGLSLLAQGATYTNVEKTQGLAVTKNVGSSSTTLSFTAANVSGASDSYAVSFAAAGTLDATATATAIDAGTLVVEGIENISINSAASVGYVNNTIDLTSGALQTVTITGGAAKTTLGFAGTNGTNVTAGGGAVKLIDASAATGAVVLDTTNVTADNSATGLTVKTGSGKDDVTLAQAATVDLGAGDDKLTTSSSATVTLGAGKDTVILHGTGITVTGNNATEAEATAKMVTIKDIGTGDKVDVLSSTTAGTASAIGAKTALTATTLADALNALADASAVLSWGQYGGNTYVVLDASSSTSGGLDTSDIVVKLEGLVDLSAATFDSTSGIITFA